VRKLKVLIVDDEVQLCESLKELFAAEKWTVDYVHDGFSAIDYIMTDTYDVVVLDIMLPGMDGLEVLKHVRRQGSTVPILLLTVKRGSSDTVTGLDLGADDYLTKPFVPSELIARMRALYRRKPNVYRSHVISVGNISLNAATFELSSDVKRIQLTSKEFDLLHLFMSNPGYVFSKETLINKIWSLDSEVMYNAVEAHISAIRKKMKWVGSKPKIVTKRGIGYVLEA
jgi:two-component system response regulator ArlR